MNKQGECCVRPGIGGRLAAQAAGTGEERGVLGRVQPVVGGARRQDVHHHWQGREGQGRRREPDKPTEWPDEDSSSEEDEET